MPALLAIIFSQSSKEKKTKGKEKHKKRTMNNFFPAFMTHHHRVHFHKRKGKKKKNTLTLFSRVQGK
jgi:hypothetical protein